MSKWHWKPFVVVSWDGYPMWGTRIILSTMIGVTLGLLLGLAILAVEL